MDVIRGLTDSVLKLKMTQWRLRQAIKRSVRRNVAIAKIGRYLHKRSYSRQLRSWEKASAADYRKAFDRLGGSLPVHPDAVELLAAMRGLPVDYRLKTASGHVVAALPFWPEGIVGANDTLKACGRTDILDLGDGELVLPLEPEWARANPLSVPGGASMLSAVHCGELARLSSCDMPLMLARGHQVGPENFSGATLSKRRRSLNKFLRNGGSISSLHDFSPAELAALYREAFALQRGMPPPANQFLDQSYAALQHLMLGHVLFMNGTFVAIKMNFAIACPRGLLVVGVNGGVNPAYRDEFQPGTILNYLDVKHAEEVAMQRNLPMRFCFGWADHAYKNDLCRPVTAYKC